LSEVRARSKGSSPQLGSEALLEARVRPPSRPPPAAARRRTGALEHHHLSRANRPLRPGAPCALVLRRPTRARWSGSCPTTRGTEAEAEAVRTRSMHDRASDGRQARCTLQRRGSPHPTGPQSEHHALTYYFLKNHTPRGTCHGRDCTVVQPGSCRPRTPVMGAQPGTIWVHC
jgi:hypothetical protein